MKQSAIGARIPRKEGLDKASGSARYVDDLQVEGLLYGATVRSPVPRGRLRRIHFGEGIPWDELTIVTARDIPGKNIVTTIVDDQPFLADELINHAEEAVVLLAHHDRYLLEEARRRVRLEIEPLPAVLSIAEALAAETTVWGEDNLLKQIGIDKGDVDAIFGRSDVIVVEGEYETGAQEQLYIEPQGMIARASPDEGVTVWGSLQCPYYVHKALGPLFGVGPDKVRVVQTTTGGGFGGKEDYPSIIAGHAALLSYKSGRPVKIVYDRAEDMAATTKRHPSRTRHRTAVSANGRLLALEIDFVIDGGAYVTISPVVLSRGMIHAAGPYRCDNVRARGRAVATNHPPCGAFRGFGAPQSIFALERHLDRIARTLDLDPVELRRRNLLRRGETTSTGQVIDEEIDLPELLDDALRHADWQRKKQDFAIRNADPRQTIKKGLGVSTFYHGSGFTGSGEVYLSSVVRLEASANGRVLVLTSSTEIGQGSNTVFSQIATDALGVPLEWIEIAQPDTAAVPDSGPTVASRTTMVVGKLVESAARQLRQKLQQAGLLDETADSEAADFEAAFAAACEQYIARHGALHSEARYQPPPGIEWDDERYRGSAYGAYGWAAYVAEVSVDTVTWQVRVDDFVAVQDIGRVINPTLAVGQVQGGVAQGIGYAIYEDVTLANGRMANNRMTNYIVPTAADLPQTRVVFKEVPYSYGPSGAKGLGELPADGPAPAVVNAIEDATGLSLCRIPALPEALMAAAMKERRDA